MSDWYRSDWQDVRPEDLEAVSKALSGGSLSVVSGGILARFEKRFADFAGARFAVATHNGTGALYGALRALGVGPGDDVLMPDHAFHGMAAAVLATGARVVPVDCREDSLAMDPADLARARTPQSKAVLVHNPWGVPADFSPLREACDLPFVSDASHAHGATYRGQPLAAWADVTCFSLGHQKLITGGELGCAVTDDPALRDRMLIQGHVNRVPGDLKCEAWQGNAVGLKMRPHPAALTLAFAQVKRFPEKRDLLRQTCGRVEEILRAAGLEPQAVPADSERVWWRIVFRGAAEAGGALRAAGVPVEPNHYWPPLQEQAIFTWPGHEQRVLRRDCPVTREVGPRLHTLPAPVLLPERAFEALKSGLESLSAPVGR